MPFKKYNNRIYEKKKWELSELCTLIFILIYRVNIIFMSGN